MCTQKCTQSGICTQSHCSRFCHRVALTLLDLSVGVSIPDQRHCRVLEPPQGP